MEHNYLGRDFLNSLVSAPTDDDGDPSARGHLLNEMQKRCKWRKKEKKEEEKKGRKKIYIYIYTTDRRRKSLKQTENQ